MQDLKQYAHEIPPTFNRRRCEIREGATAFYRFWGWAAYCDGRCVVHAATAELCERVLDALDDKEEE